MKKQLDLGFCNLTYSDKKKLTKKGIITNAYNLNKEFFKINIPKFEIQFVYSREEFNKLWGFETEDFVSAFVKDNKIVIFDYSIFDKVTRWEKEKFSETLIHEINHLFYEKMRNHEYDPLWLSEGLATFMQHGQKKFHYKEKLKITKNILEGASEHISLNNYQVYALFVEYLFLEYGKEKILKLIRGLKRGKKLNKLFQEVYKKIFEELIKDGNKYQKTFRD